MTKENVLVRFLHEGEESLMSLFHDMEALFEDVRKKAFELSSRRGFAEGHELEDWLEAEKKVLGAVRVELLNQDKDFSVRIEVAGYEPGELEVTATKDAVIVQGHARHEEKKTEGALCFTEFGERQFLRRIDLPELIELDAVKAVVDKGILTITAPKTDVKKAIPTEKKVLIASA